MTNFKVASRIFLADRRMNRNMEFSFLVTERGTPQYSEEYQSHSHFICAFNSDAME